MEITNNESTRISNVDLDCSHTVGDVLAAIPERPPASFGSGASLFFILSPASIAERRVGEWISKKERDGLKLHSIQFFKGPPGRDRETIHFHEEIRLLQTGPILVLGFKEG